MIRKTIMCFMVLFLLICFSGCGQGKASTEYINDDYLQLPLFQASMKNGKFQTTDTDVRIMVASEACKVGSEAFDPAWLICDELKTEELLAKEPIFDWKALLEAGETYEYVVFDKTNTGKTIPFGEATKETVKQIFEQMTCKAQIPSYFRVMNIQEEEMDNGTNRVVLSFVVEDAKYTIRIDGHDDSGVWVRIECEEKEDGDSKTKMYAFFEGMTIQECMKAIQ